MGLFAGPWKQLLTRSPAYFSEAARDWETSIAAAISERVPRSEHGLARSYVLGRLGLALHRITGDWTDDGARFLAAQTSSAENLISASGAGGSRNIMDALWGDALLRAAYNGPVPFRTPSNGQTPASAAALPPSRANTWAVAGNLFSATGSAVTIKRLELDAARSPKLLRVSYAYEPMLTPPQDAEVYLAIEGDDPPSTDPAA